MSKKCSPEEAALKSFFLGPQAENSNWVRHEILHVLDHWFQWRQDLFPEDGEAISREDQKSPDFQNRRLKTQEVLQELCRRFEAEIPQFSPRYVGHMYSEISLPALFGHFAALLHNPNNISTEAARVGAIIENEAIHDLAVMMGFDSEKATGHFTSGGTVANIEALWRARYRMDHFLSLGCYLNLHQGKNLSYCEAAGMGWDQFEKYLERYNIDEMNLKKFSVVAQGPWNIGPVYEKAYKKPFRGPAILVPNSKHYSWMKGISLLGFGDQAFVPVELDEQGVLDINSLQQQIEKSLKEDTPLMMIVSVAGTTELGQCDPIEQICEILSNLQQTRRLHIWHHVDAAYGGYFCSLLDNGESEVLDKNLAHSFAAIRKTDSVTIDPHKLGYVPYACGAFIVPDEIHYRVSAFDAKYIQSPNKNVDRWMKTLEGSRSASGAAATWMTAKTIGFNPDGYGKILNRAILARRQLAEDLKSECPNIKILETQELNLIDLVLINKATTLSMANEQTEKWIDAVNASNEFMVSQTHLKTSAYKKIIEKHCREWGLKMDSGEEGLVLMRMTIMNPFFLNKESTTHYERKLVEVLKRTSGN